MSETKNGGPAFPRDALGYDCNQPYGQQDGMSLRDWFAGQAITGIASLGGDGFSLSPQDGAVWAYQYADAMLAARGATNG